MTPRQLGPVTATAGGLLACIGLSLAAAGASAQQADPVAAILGEARAFCESYENGRFDAGAAVREMNLDGQEPIDRIVDESAFSCSSMMSAYCGSGGCMLHAVVEDAVRSFQAEGWRMVEWDGRPILLIARDGGWCGGAGAQVCYEAVVWSNGQALSVMPQPDG
ncbi:hypothetical protein SAMN05444722_2448 [Rhodovulum sp. ES.010]|uniref:hypothetical protein n=1 Tax=Rhodovulum sp. ES.010 TaxID=1882821 RepID=UPI000928360F|nr:hypothetical protein [Rhodovulum sp. ES.010]SIO47730.1 hypothetical protein SAMN05444722_2448 [Rhodovulum sp. ES.010]